MKNAIRRIGAALLCLAMVLCILPAMPMEAEAANHGLYKDLALVTNLSGSGCPSMQGLAICGSYFYAVKTDGDDYAATVCRVHRTDGTKSWLTNTANNSNFFYDFGHGNDVEVVEAGGTVNMFVPTSTKGSNSLVRYTISGTKATKHSGYTMMHNGSQISGGAIRAVRVDDENIYLLFKCGDECYYTTLPIDQKGGTLEMTYLCTLDYSTAVVNGTAQDVSDWSLQGMGYYDHMLYLPLSSHTTSDWSMSIVLVYDLEGASGTIKPLDDPTFKITSGAYAALFEMESCVINPYDGRLYFSTNRRVSSSDTNHDGISYITNWVYEPDKRTSEVKDYRWEVQDGKLMSVTSEGSSYNGLAHHGGSINGTNLTDAQYTTAQNINLKHDRPWVLEWRSNAFSAGSLMFATYRTSGYTNNAYVFNRVDNVLISMGYHDGTRYNNYGINPQDYGIDTSVTHTYRLSNKIASDGSNMVYLSVDGTELGALNNYYIASTYQGTTSNWISGKDFSFSYLGTSGHPVNLDGLEYIQVWGDGIPAEDKDSNLYRWETSGNALNAVTGGNTLNKTFGTVSGTTFTGVQYDLTKDITLFHDRSWSIEWEGSYSSGTMLLAADHMGNTECAPYLYRSGVVAFGERKNGNHHNYGIKLSDYGISYADNHVYKLVNRLNADGSNMVYLFVDGKEIGPMNQYFTGTTATGTTVNWLSGRDLTFSYIGTYQYKLAGNMNYLQVDEGNCGHIYGPWSESNETCEADGTRSRTCTLCGNVETETVPATGHSYKTTVTAPTCTERGYTTYTCSCGHSYVADYVSATGHSYSAKVTTAPGCESAGVRTYTCSKCGDSYTESISPVGHSYKTTVTAPTCTERGYTTYTCSCGDSYVADYVSATGHSYSSKVTTAPGCESTGVRTYTCGKCGDSYTEIIAATGHAYDLIVTEPTCENKGYTTYVCACGSSFVGGYTDPIGHSWDKGVTTKSPTCTADGVKTFTCGTCGATKTESIAANGHSYVNGKCSTCGTYQCEEIGHNYKSVVTAPTCTAKGYTTYTCSICKDTYISDYVGALGHSYDKGVVTKQPTCTATGTKTYTCSKCGDSYTETIKATGHSHTAKVTAPTCTAKGYTTYTCACGDSYVADEVAALGHSYVNGVCSVCGAKDPDYVEIVAPTISLQYPTLLLEDEIKMNVFFTLDQEIDLNKMGMLTWTSKPSVVDISTADAVIPGGTYNSQLGFYGVATEGIPAQNLGDVVYFCIYVELADGSIAYGKQVQYSPTTYAYNQLNGDADAATKALFVAILNYGSAAQVFLNDTDPLINANLTAEQKALVEEFRADMVHSVAMPDAAKQGAMAANGGFSSKRPTISLDSAFAINYFFTPSATVKGNMTFYYWNAADFAAADVLSIDNATGSAVMVNEDGVYGAAIEGIAAKDIDSALYACGVYTDVDGNTYSTGILPYSLGFYCGNTANGEGALADLAAAIAVYGYYAVPYFAGK